MRRRRCAPTPSRRSGTPPALRAVPAGAVQRLDRAECLQRALVSATARWTRVLRSPLLARAGAARDACDVHAQMPRRADKRRTGPADPRVERGARRPSRSNTPAARSTPRRCVPPTPAGPARDRCRCRTAGASWQRSASSPADATPTTPTPARATGRSAPTPGSGSSTRSGTGAARTGSSTSARSPTRWSSPRRLPTPVGAQVDARRAGSTCSAAPSRSAAGRDRDPRVRR